MTVMPGQHAHEGDILDSLVAAAVLAHGHRPAWVKAELHVGVEDSAMELRICS